MKFKDLKLGQEFDFVSPGGFNSFVLRCTKISTRKYKDENGTEHTIGTTSCKVFNVSPAKGS